jgi:hypothetical protein
MDAENQNLNFEIEQKFSLKWDNQSLTSHFENYDCAEYIRDKHNIIAEAIGTPKTARKQNKTLSKPFILNKNETFYLLEMYYNKL